MSSPTANHVYCILCVQHRARPKQAEDGRQRGKPLGKPPLPTTVGVPVVLHKRFKGRAFTNGHCQAPVCRLLLLANHPPSQEMTELYADNSVGMEAGDRSANTDGGGGQFPGGGWIARNPPPPSAGTKRDVSSQNFDQKHENNARNSFHLEMQWQIKTRKCSKIVGRQVGRHKGGIQVPSRTR